MENRKMPKGCKKFFYFLRGYLFLVLVAPFKGFWGFWEAVTGLFRIDENNPMTVRVHAFVSKIEKRIGEVLLGGEPEKFIELVRKIFAGAIQGGLFDLVRIPLRVFLIFSPVFFLPDLVGVFYFIGIFYYVLRS